MNTNNTPKILIVDNSTSSIILLQNILDKNTYNIKVAKNCKEALKTASEELPDIVLLEILIPEIKGLEVLEKIKKDKKTKHIPVIMVTKLNTPAYKEEAFRLGAASYISKPFDNKMILKQINSHLYKNNFYKLKIA